MSEELTPSLIHQALDYAYDHAINGLPGTQTAIEMAQSYLEKNDNDPHKAAASLVNWQSVKAGSTGFLTGIGGLLTMPVSIPADLASVLYIQVRMIAVIAIMGGHDPREDQTRTLVYGVLAANTVAELTTNFGVKLGQKLTQKTIERISRETLVKINQGVGFRLVTKFGQTGLINLGKAIPFVGGAVNAGFNVTWIRVSGNIARKSLL